MVSKQKPPSVRAYFRQVFEENPDWLALPDNTLPLQRWSADHGNRQPDEKVRQSMASLKSALRVEQGIAVRGPTALAHGDERKLEELIGTCIDLAGQLDQARFGLALRCLRKALAHTVLAVEGEE